MGFFRRTTSLFATAKAQKKRRLTLVIAVLLLASLALPASASTFDPLTKALSPLYQKFKKNKVDPSQASENRPSVPDIALDSTISNTNSNLTNTPNNNTSIDVNTNTDNPNGDSTAQNTPNTAPDSAPNPFLPPDDTPTPDLFAVLNAEFAIDRDSPETALSLYKHQALKANATAVFERALQLSMQLETPVSSLEFAQAWQANNQDHIPAWFYVTHLALKAENYPVVSQNLKAILDYDPKADLSKIFAGILPSSPQAGQELFFALQSLDENDNPSLSVLKAGLLAQLGEPKAAILHINNALRADANNLAYLILKADILKFHDSSRALHQFLNKSLKTTKGDTKKQLYLYQIRHLIDTGELSTAWERLKSAHKDFPDDLEITLLASLVALDTHRYDDANQLLLLLTQNPATESEAYYYLGLSHERTQKIDEAVSYFAKVKDMQFVLPATQKQVGYALAQNDADKAIALLLALRSNFEMYASESYTMQADILLKIGKKQEAATLLEEAYRQYPDDLSLLYASTQLLDNDSDYDKKQANLHRLLDFDPLNPAYRLDMAALILQRTPDDADSLATAKEISQISFESPDYDSARHLSALLLLANHALNQQDYRAVIDYLQTPYEVAPNLQAGIALLRAYRGLEDSNAVNRLLTDLTMRFAGTLSTDPTQDY